MGPDFFCVGLNYAKPAAEADAEPPKESILFFMARSALNGTYDRGVIPRNSVNGGWEVELAVGMGL